MLQWHPSRLPLRLRHPPLIRHLDRRHGIHPTVLVLGHTPCSIPLIASIDLLPVGHKGGTACNSAERAKKQTKTETREHMLLERTQS